MCQNMPMCPLLVQGSVFSVPANMPTLEALSQMARDHKSSLGVTDPASGQLISNLSVSDLRCVTPQGLDSSLTRVTPQGFR